MTVLNDRSLALEDYFSREIKFLLKERTWLEERECPRSVECRLSVIIKNCNYITYTTCECLTLTKLGKSNIFYLTTPFFNDYSPFLHSFLLYVPFYNKINAEVIPHGAVGALPLLVGLQETFSPIIFHKIRRAPRTLPPTQNILKF